MQPVKRKIQETHEELIKEPTTLTLLVDGNSLLFTAMRDETINTKGEHVGGVYQFMLQLRIQLEKRTFDRVFVTFDDEFSGVLRYNIYKPYKGNRDKNYASYGMSDYMKDYNKRLRAMEEYIFNKKVNTSNEEGNAVTGQKNNDYQERVDENFVRERNILCEMFNELCIRWNMDEVTEGDDLIAYYCKNKRKNERILIVSSDMDLCQLLSDDVIIYNQQLKKYISKDNFKQYFGYHYKNVMLKKILCGDTSDNIGNIKGLSEEGLKKLMPEIATKEIVLEDVFSRVRELKEERLKKKKKPLQLYENILSGASNKKYEGDFYDINRKIIDLNNPLLTESCEEEMKGIVSSPLDFEDRSIDNLLRIINENEITEWMSDTKFSSFFRPFNRIRKTEEEYVSKLG